MADLKRQTVFDSCGIVAITNPAVSLMPMAPQFTWNLRAAEPAADLIAQTLDLDGTPSINRCHAADTRTMAKLGPDEYLILSDRDDKAIIEEAAKAHFIALTDIGHRLTGLKLQGPAAADTINGACPLDLFEQSTPAGSFTRTVMGKAEILLHRQTEERFALYTNRSLMDYLWHLCDVLAQEHRANP